VKITAIRLDRMRLPLVPPFRAAWDPVPREAFDATLVRVETDEGVTGYAVKIRIDRTDVGGGPYLEFPYDPPGWTVARRDFFLAEQVRIDADGCLSVPGRPGLGAEIDEAAVRRWARS
jgi:L-alanine-DL-glutamate epimerase-like enolase superfamily enzyme